MLRIAIVIGSTRPGRRGEVIAKWAHEIAAKRSDAKFELVDIKDRLLSNINFKSVFS